MSKIFVFAVGLFLLGLGSLGFLISLAVGGPTFLLFIMALSGLFMMVSVFFWNRGEIP